MKNTVDAKRILAWNSMRETVKGKDYYYIFDVEMDSFDGKKWIFIGMHGITFDPFGNYYTKEVKGTWWLYLERQNGEKERFNINDDLCKSFFGIIVLI